ncbi:MAG: TetR/AcrR family transcriptional regulator [Proteobacteria bacterium]|nr:TetR/AcrR family transcriptional regulator [Pseudomonadota bacterium]
MAGKKRTLVRREQIVKAAKKVFAAKGFYEATISDIAREAQLSEPTIYEYFTSKEDVLFTIPGEQSVEARRTMEPNLNMFQGAANKLRGIIYTLWNFYQTDQEYAAVAMLILKQNRKFIGTENYNAVRQYFRLMYDVIKEGQAGGEFRSDISPFFIRSVVIGTIEHLTTRKVLYDTENSLVEFVDPLIEVLTNGVAVRPGPADIQVHVTMSPYSGGFAPPEPADAGLEVGNAPKPRRERRTGS